MIIVNKSISPVTPPFPNGGKTIFVVNCTLLQNYARTSVLKHIAMSINQVSIFVVFNGWCSWALERGTGSVNRTPGGQQHHITRYSTGHGMARHSREAVCIETSPVRPQKPSNDRWGPIIIRQRGGQNNDCQVNKCWHN